MWLWTGIYSTLIIIINSYHTKFLKFCDYLKKGCAEAYASAKSTCLRMYELDHPRDKTSEIIDMNCESIFARATNGDVVAQDVLDIVSNNE